MKKITREETKVITREFYVSVDGKEFTTEEDCKKWENSYKGTISASWELLKKQEISSSLAGIPYGCEVTVTVNANTTIKQYKQYAAALADLKAGRIDAILMDKLPAQIMLANAGN